MRVQMIRLLVFYLVSILGKSTSAFDDTASSLKAQGQSMDDINSFESNNVPNKRSYTYVSEYKRLPVYNFGLGKRAYGVQNLVAKRAKPYSFGLGKRARSYNFGIGKKNDRMMAADWPEVNYDDMYWNEEDPETLHEKRANRLNNYDFGVGKREDDPMNPESINGKRARSFDFGLGKRSVDSLRIKGNGLMKKGPYNFGLGKRSTDKYNFGLGKRTSETSGDEEAVLLL